MQHHECPRKRNWDWCREKYHPSPFVSLLAGQKTATDLLGKSKWTGWNSWDCSLHFRITISVLKFTILFRQFWQRIYGFCGKIWREKICWDFNFLSFFCFSRSIKSSCVIVWGCRGESGNMWRLNFRMAQRGRSASKEASWPQRLRETPWESERAATDEVITYVTSVLGAHIKTRGPKLLSIFRRELVWLELRLKFYTANQTVILVWDKLKTF